MNEICVLTRPQQQVKRVAPQAIGQQAHVGAFPGFAEEFHEGGEVAVLAKDGPAAIPSIEDVVAVSVQSIACAAWLTCPLFHYQRQRSLGRFLGTQASPADWAVLDNHGCVTATAVVHPRGAALFIGNARRRAYIERWVSVPIQGITSCTR
jgi:hypothetical protein